MPSENLSRRTLIATATATAAAAVVTTASAAPSAANPSVAAVREGGARRVRQLLSGMTLEEKVGQLFVSWVAGHSATDPAQGAVDANLNVFGVRTAAEMVERYHVGGICYFAWADNVNAPHQIVDLSNGIQKAALGTSAGVPVLIAVDQENGARVTRIGEPVTQWPGAMALGASRSRKNARDVARYCGAELSAMGIHQNYCPVGDVNVNPANPVIGIRSFGSDPAAAARMVGAQVRAYQRERVATSAKHFPGHGDTTVDSHTGLPLITHTREEWERIDAPPFRAAIAAGADSIMTAHIQFPALDPTGEPATLSRPILQGILREELGFEGVIVSDALNMEAVRIKYGDARIPVLALKAGVDQLLYPYNLRVAWDAVLAAVQDGEITEARLDESVLRILTLKDKLGLLKDPYSSRDAVDRTVGIARHRAAAERIAEETTTLLVNEDEALPLNRRRDRNLLIVGADPDQPVLAHTRPVDVLSRELTELGFTTTALPFKNAPTAAQIDAAVAAADGKDAIVVTSMDVIATSSQRTLVSRLVATGVPVVSLAIANPYDIAQFEGVSAALASYGWTPVELRAAAKVIAGRVEPEGRLPVPVPKAGGQGVLFPLGHGLDFD